MPLPASREGASAMRPAVLTLNYAPVRPVSLEPFMGFLAGKRALIVGLATERSIAHGIATAMHREGAELAFTYQGDRLKDRVVEMAQGFGSAITLPMDVASDAEIEAAFAQIRTVWDS